MTSLPHRWVLTTLGEVTVPEINQGGPTGIGEFLYVDISSVDNRTKRISSPKSVLVTEAPTRARQRLTSGDVLVSMTRPNLNAVAIVPQNMDGAIGSTGFHVLRAAGIDPFWLYYLVQTSDFVTKMSNSVQGVVYPAVRPKDIEGCEIPLAALAEQLRIVAEIEKQFTRLDAGVAALKRVRTDLQRYRASLLRAACEGRLVPSEAEIARSEGRDYEPAESLVNRILTRASSSEPEADLPFRPSPAPEGWAWVRFGALLREPLRNGRSAKRTEDPDGVRTLTLTAVTVGDFSESNTKRTRAKPEDVEELWLHPGDILIERSNTPDLVGTARLYRGPPNFAIFPDLLIRARVSTEIEGSFVEAVLRSTYARNYFRRHAQGIAGHMPKINQEVVAGLPIPLPPSAEQTRIVTELDRQLSVVGKLEIVVRNGAERAALLRASILKNAFEGRLITPDWTDEPAAVLLDRILEAKDSARDTTSARCQERDMKPRRRKRGR